MFFFLPEKREKRGFGAIFAARAAHRKGKATDGGSILSFMRVLQRDAHRLVQRDLAADVSCDDFAALPLNACADDARRLNIVAGKAAVFHLLALRDRTGDTAAAAAALPDKAVRIDHLNERRHAVRFRI